jgi:catechol 2,3-dioxygenase-like lactoylglutathione lyase family enzyme
MKPHITIITLGVDDLERSLSFYRDGLGLPTQGIIGQEVEYGAVVFFELQHGVKLALWPRASIAHDTHLSVQAPSATDFTLAHNVSSKEEVDLVMQQAKAAGATIIKAAQETFYGGLCWLFPGSRSACLGNRLESPALA